MGLLPGSEFDPIVDGRLAARLNGLTEDGIRRVYIAGPMTGRVDWNFPAFREAAAFFRAMGFLVVNPVEIDASVGHDVFADGPQSHRDYMRRDLPAVMDCDAVAVLDGWKDSKGASLEVRVAHACGLTIVDAATLDVIEDPFEAPSIVQHFAPTILRHFGEPREPVYVGFDVSSEDGIPTTVAVVPEDGGATWKVCDDTYVHSPESFRAFLAGTIPAPVVDCDPADETAEPCLDGEACPCAEKAADSCPCDEELPDDVAAFLAALFGIDVSEEVVEHVEAKAKEDDAKGGGPFAEVGGEVRVTSSTGGEKGKKPEQFSAMPWDALLELAAHYGKGAEKYAAHNYRRGYAWSLSFDAALRHLAAFWQGEDLDPETGSKHVLAAAFHALALAVFMDEKREFDDRPSATLREAA